MSMYLRDGPSRSNEALALEIQRRRSCQGL